MATWRQTFPGMPLKSLEWSPSTTPDDPTPVWETLSDRILEIHMRSYRQTELDQFETAELTCVLDNSDRALEPLGGGGQNVPRVRIRYQLQDEDGEVYDRFGGFVRSIVANWADPPFATVTLKASDYGLLLATTEVRVDGYPRELVHDRINRVLDDMTPAVPAADREIDTSDAWCEAIDAVAAGENPTMANALKHVQDAALSDGGYAFVDIRGRIRFHNRRKRMDEFGGVHLTFGDDEDSVEVVDEFDGSALNTALWTLSPNANTPLTVTGGQAVFTNNGSVGQPALTYTSLVDWSDGGQATIYSPTLPLIALDHRLYIRARFSGDNNNRIEIRFQNAAGTRQIVATSVVSGSATNHEVLISDDYSYARIRAKDGVIYWEVSADGVRWLILASEDAPIAITALEIQIPVGPQSGTPVAYTHRINWVEIQQGECPYQPDISGETNDATLWTSWTVKTANDVAETHEGSTTISGYKAAREEFQSLLAYPGQAAALASLTPWRYANAIWRLPALKPTFGNPRMTKAMVRAILSADVGARFRFLRRPPETTPSDPVDLQLHVEGMAEDVIVGDPDAIAFSVSPADPPLDEWVLGTSQLGVDSYVGI